MKRQLGLAFLTTCALGACSPAANTSEPAGASARAIGADRDAHGCIGSAGYTWSQVRQACIRIFEAGLAFAPDPAQARAEGGGVLQAFVVLAPEAGDTVTAAEAFVPGRASAIALTVVLTPEGDIRPTVLVNQAEGVEVFRYKHEFVLDINGQRFRRQSAPDDRLFLIR